MRHTPQADLHHALPGLRCINFVQRAVVTSSTVIWCIAAWPGITEFFPPQCPAHEEVDGGVSSHSPLTFLIEAPADLPGAGF